MKKNTEKQLIFLNKFIPISVVFIFSLSITLVIINNSIQQGKQDISQIRQSFINRQKDIVKNEVSRLLNHIEYEKKLSKENLKKKIKEKVDEAHTIITSIYTNNIHRGKDTVVKLIKDALRDVRFNDARGYFFIYSSDLKNILLPIAPHLEGKDFSSYTDMRGDYVVKNVAALVKKNNTTFYTWYWRKPLNDINHYKKIGFFKYFEPLDWFIGTGEYLVDFEKQLQEGILKETAHMRYGANGYIFINHYDGTTLADINQSAIGINRLYLRDKNGLFVNQEAIKIAKNGGGFLEFIATPDSQSNRLYKKISYISGIDDWQWQIAAVSQLSDVEAEIEKKTKSLNAQLNDTLIKIVSICVIVGIVLMLLSLKISSIVQELFFKSKQSIFDEVEKNKKQFALMQQQSKLASMGEMLGNIAHQWRQPLNTLSISLSKMSLLQEDGKLTKEIINSSFTRMEESIIYLSKTIDVFRDFLNPNDTTKEFNLKNEIQNVIAIVHDSFAHNFITLTCSCDEDIVLVGSKKEFQQSIINIVSNAKDAINSKKIEQGKVSIYVSKSFDKIKISIQDNGGGIDKKLKDRIFEPYFTTKFKSQGTGIGLYMSKAIIEKNFNGSLEFENKNDGVEFCIIINIKGAS